MSLPFRKLVLGGGGMKGIMHIGVLKELAKHQELKFPDGVWGCSVGAIIAVNVAFELPLNTDLISKYMKFDDIIHEIGFNDIRKVFNTKGLFTMDKFEETFVNFYQTEYNLDITKIRIKDAKMPLYIVASNITKGVPTIFSEDVFVMDALRCSCCIPLMFKPQELYGQLYVDGGLLAPYLAMIVPDGLNLVLTKKKNKQFTTETLDSISPVDYMRQLFSMAMNQFHKFHKHSNSLELGYPKLHSDSDLSQFDIQDILDHSAKLLNDFLLTKSRNQESSETST
jgi:predicted acylesterase/phospholipase RssA